MLKHVQISPLRNRADSVSLRSSASCASSMCGSPEPPTDLQRTPSRASSYSSLNEQLPQTTIKVFTSCLKIDIEYKTLGIQWETTSKEVIAQLLRRLKMRHRDPRLFYLSMEVCVRRAGVKTILVLDDDTRPAILQACHPKGESRFCLQLKPGGLIRVHTSALQPTSQYKSLVISEETTSDELLQLLLSCYNSMEPVEQFSIYEVCPGQEYQRKLHPDDLPLRAQAERMKRGETCHFLVRRNPNYARRRQLLAALNDVRRTPGTGSNFPSPAVSSRSFDADSTISSLEDSASLLDMSIESLPDDLNSLMASDDDDLDLDLEDLDRNSNSSAGSSSASSTSSASSSSSGASSDNSTEGSLSVRRRPVVGRTSDVAVAGAGAGVASVCSKCRNSFKSCEFCHKNSSLMQLQRRATVRSIATATNNNNSPNLASYSPVYNIREIRTASHSFSSLGNDKKLLDIHLNGRFDAATATACRMRPQSVYVGRSMARMLLDAPEPSVATSAAATAAKNSPTSTGSGSDVNGNVAGPATPTAKATPTAPAVAAEAVNNNPAKGLGHFVYI